jgi:O-antigen ligase
MAGITIGLLAAVVENSAVMRLRLESAEQGEMAGREELFPASWHMFLEKPLGGWGPINNQYEVLPRAPDHMPAGGGPRADAHNLFLDLLTATGLLGAVPFVIALALCVRAAWRARGGEYGVLPLALVGLFLTANLSLNQLTYKPFWVVLAFALASERCLTKTRRARTSIAASPWRGRVSAGAVRATR